MSDFFGALELELRAAAARRPRRTFGIGRAAGLAGTVLLAAVAVMLTMVVRGGGETESGRFSSARIPDPVGTVIEKGEGEPPRPRRSTVVATGRHPAIGPWQLEAYRSDRLADPETGEVYQPAGLRCLMIYLLDPPGRKAPREPTSISGEPLSASGQCGEFPRTPGFSRIQHGQGPVLVYGRVPRRATAVQVLVPGRKSIAARIHEGPRKSSGDFYSVVLRPPFPRASVQWFGERGLPGSRGIRLMPPLSR